MITTKDSGIEAIEDLKGKRRRRSPNSGVELNARAVLKPTACPTMTSRRTSLLQRRTTASNGTVDAALSPGIPNPAVTDLSTTHEVKVIPIEGEGMKKLKELYPYYAENTIPKGTYGNKEDVPTASISEPAGGPRYDMDERRHRLTKTMFENLKRSRARTMPPAIQLETIRVPPVPFTRG